MNAQTLMANASDRLRKNAEWRKKHGKTNTCKAGTPNRKSAKHLEARIHGWTASLNDPANRDKDMSGYHKPGSLNRF